MGSNMRLVRSDELLDDKEVSSILLRLMMALNDSSLANNALREWSESKDRIKTVRMFGGKIYFVRVQFGHVYEAMLVIEEAAKLPKFRDLV
jgi:hypothetical protein